MFPPTTRKSGIIATDIGHTCDVHHFDCGKVLLLATTTQGSSVLLCLPDMMSYI